MTSWGNYPTDGWLVLPTRLATGHLALSPIGGISFFDFFESGTMARTSTSRGYRKGVGSRYKKRTSTQRRKAGSYGLYRSTKFRGMRSTARSLSTRIPYSLNPFPQSKLVRHKYCDTITIAAAGGAGVAQSYGWRANSLFDPDLTGVGHQPMFYDEMAAQYKYYTVLSSTIVLHVEAESTIGRILCLYTDDDTTIPADYTDLMEQHRFYAGVKLDKRHAPLVLKSFYDAAKYNKSTRQGILGDADQKIAVGSNPAAPVLKYYTFVSYPDKGTATLDAVTFAYKMYFTVLWREPVDHIGS